MNTPAAAPAGVAAGAGSRPLSLLKLARPRTWYFASSMWLVAYLSTGSWRASGLLVGLVVCVLLTAATNLFNVLTDRREDRRNLPRRALLVDRVGPARLRSVTAGCYLVAVAVALAFTNPVHAALCLLGAAVSVSYSWGLRFKVRPVSSLVSISAVVVLPFVAGWSMAAPILEVTPLVLVFGLSFLAYANLKNLPDEAGDRAAGARTLFTAMSTGGSGRLLLLLLCLLWLPFLLLAGLVAAGLVAPRCLLLLVFLPGPLVLLRGIRRAVTEAEKEGVHALAYVYQMGFFTAGLVVYEPTVAAASVVTALALGSLTFEALGVDSRPRGLARLWRALWRLPENR